MFARAKNDGAFENIKLILGISSRQELKEKYDEAMSGTRAQRWSPLTFHSHVSFKDLMNYDEITKIKA
ncbi:MAG: hypothetical protein ABIC04_08185 [Nanoarchaeota archaeon]